VVRSEDVVVVGQETVDGEAEEPDPDMKKSNRRCAGSRLEFGRLPDWICSEDNLTFHCLVSLFPWIDSGNVPFSHPIVDIPCVTITCRTSLCVTHCCKVGRCARPRPHFSSQSHCWLLGPKNNVNFTNIQKFVTSASVAEDTGSETPSN